MFLTCDTYEELVEKLKEAREDYLKAKSRYLEIEEALNAKSSEMFNELMNSVKNQEPPNDLIR